jgi:hypothetical protein
MMTVQYVREKLGIGQRYETGRAIRNKLLAQTFVAATEEVREPSPDSI